MGYRIDYPKACDYLREFLSLKASTGVYEMMCAAADYIKNKEDIKLLDKPIKETVSNGENKCQKKPIKKLKSSRKRVKK